MGRKLLVGFGAMSVVALVASSALAREPVAAMPGGKVIVREQCFGAERDEESSKSKRSYNVAPPAKAPAGPAPMPSPSPAPLPSMPSAKPTPMAAQPAAEASPIAARPPVPPKKDLAEDKAESSASLGDSIVAGETSDDQRQAGPVADWGGEIYLSNDDSMSLASAQRLLWAAERGAGWTVDQIRPHELLNYFSFDSTEPDADQVLDVTVSAERDGKDRLKMAMTVKGAKASTRPLDVTFVLDRSGSMSAEGRMEYLKRGLRQSTEQLHKGDRVDIVLFDHEACSPLENFVVGRDDMGLLNRVIDQLAPRGATDVGIGLKEGYRVARAHEDVAGRNRRMMLITDAQLNTGDVNHDTVTEIGKEFEKSGIRLTGIGVGTDFNDDVLDKLTEKGQGSYVFLGSEAVVDRIFGVGWPSLVETIAEDVHFKLDLPPSLAMERFYGEEASAVKEDVQAIHYAAGTTQTFFQDLMVKDGKLAGDEKISFEASYTNPNTGRAETRTFTTKVSTMLEADTHNVRKAGALMAWSDVLFSKAQTGSCDPTEVQEYADAASTVEDDIEVRYVTGLVEKSCGKLPSPALASAAKVSFKVRLDSDIPIAEVALACGKDSTSKKVSGGTTVFTFEGRPGACDVVLGGAVAMVATVDVPEVGGDVRCVVRGGRFSCAR